MKTLANEGLSSSNNFKFQGVAKPQSVSDEVLKVLEGDLKLDGCVNVEDDTIQQHIAHSIRLGFPQIRPAPISTDRVVLVGGGPSLASTEKVLIDLVMKGAKLVTMNGSYHWCLERNLKPNAQIVLDARDWNGRFLDPYVEGVKYVVASQCHPSTWERLKGRPNVWIFHGVNPEGREKAILDAYYFERWHGVYGGTTVATRAIALLRMTGHLRYDLFGVDSCWMGHEHHAFAQPENEKDRKFRITVAPTGGGLSKIFTVSPWHVKQFEDFLQFIRVNGQHFLLNVHGDGLIAFAIQANAELTIQETH